MPTIELNGTTLYYEDTGPGSTGETIAFSHGLLWGTELFEAQIAALRQRYRCIAWDHRGQGKSAADHRHCIGIELVTQDAIALLEAVAAGITGAKLVRIPHAGHSSTVEEPAAVTSAIENFLGALPRSK